MHLDWFPIKTKLLLWRLQSGWQPDTIHIYFQFIIVTELTFLGFLFCCTSVVGSCYSEQNDPFVFATVVPYHTRMAWGRLSVSTLLS